MTPTEHISDGSDEAGVGLEITIRIDPGGRVYFADITPGILQAALAAFPDDAALRARAERAGVYRTEEAS